MGSLCSFRIFSFMCVSKPPLLSNGPPANSTPRFPTLPFNRKLWLREVYEYMDGWAKRYPQIVSVDDIGTTFENRPIKCLKIWSGLHDAEAMVIVGAIRGNDWAVVSSVLYVLKELLENRGTLPANLLGQDFYIIPVLNPDGYHYNLANYKKDWAKNRSPQENNCTGVYINRNFNVSFGVNGSEPCDPDYQGAAPISELETRALTEFLLTLKGRLRAYISFEGQGYSIGYPYGYKMYPGYDDPDPDIEEMHRVGTQLLKPLKDIDGQYHHSGTIAVLMKSMSGRSEDWVKHEIGAKYIYSIQLEKLNGLSKNQKVAFKAVEIIGNPVAKKKDPPTSSNPTFDFRSNQRLDEVYGYMDGWAKRYPQIVKVNTIGITFENRPIKCLKIRSGHPNAEAFVIVGAIRGNDWAVVSSVLYVLKELLEKRETLHENLLEQDFYFISVLNPDGYHYSLANNKSDWTKNRAPQENNCTGVYINRNFDVAFGVNGSEPCDPDYQGAAPNSELETRALTKFLLTLKGRLRAYISFEGQGYSIGYPYGYKINPGYDGPDIEEMGRVAGQLWLPLKDIDGYYHHSGTIAAQMGYMSGRSEDWVMDKIGAKYIYCIQLDEWNGLYINKLVAFKAVEIIGNPAAKKTGKNG